MVYGLSQKFSVPFDVPEDIKNIKKTRNKKSVSIYCVNARQPLQQYGFDDRQNLYRHSRDLNSGPL